MLARRLVGWVVVALAAALACAIVAGSAGAVASGSGHASGRISFYADINEPVNSASFKNPLSVRPSVIAVFEDGSWVLANLRWRGWGSPVAHATGVSSASNCKPNCAAGKRKNRPAKLTLSSPGRVRGHEVYRCFQLTVPPPASSLHECLKRTGKLILYSPVSKPVSKSATTTGSTTPPQTPTATSGIAFSPNASGGTCLMNDNGTAHGSWVFCWVGASWPPSIHAKLRLNGSFDKRTLIPEPMGLGGRSLPYGRSLTVGRFRCRSAAAGLTCVVVKTGKGLAINAAGVKRVGP